MTDHQAPPALPETARYRHRRAVVTADRHLQDTTPIVIPRGLLTALTGRLFHTETPLQRPTDAGACQSCDLIALTRQHTRPLNEEPSAT